MISLTPYTLLLFILISILDLLVSMYFFINVFRWIYHRDDEQAIRSLIHVLNAPVVASGNLIQRFYEADYPRQLPLFIVGSVYVVVRYALNYFIMAPS